MIDAEWGEVMDQTDSDADERAEKSTSLNDVYVYVSHKNGRFAGAMAGCSTMPRRCETGECDPGDGSCIACGAISGEVCQDQD